MRRLLVLVLALTACTASVALAASKNGITPTAPKKGSTVAVGSRPVFKGKVSGPGKVFVYVSRSRKTDKEGLIGDKELIQEAKRTKTSFKTKAKFFDYPSYWLNRPGTYYWQAHRVDCSTAGSSDCEQEGPIVKFKVG